MRYSSVTLTLCAGVRQLTSRTVPPPYDGGVNSQHRRTRTGPPQRRVWRAGRQDDGTPVRWPPGLAAAKGPKVALARAVRAHQYVHVIQRERGGADRRESLHADRLQPLVPHAIRVAALRRYRSRANPVSVGVSGQRSLRSVMIKPVASGATSGIRGSAREGCSRLAKSLLSWQISRYRSPQSYWRSALIWSVQYSSSHLASAAAHHHGR
jgi:hypothetical protein